MKPLRLEMEAFLPYVNKQVVDFEYLSKYGLFLIYGKTGSGKTSILDGITFALFGQSSSGTRGDTISMRSKFAKEAQNTKVCFEFSLHNKQYKFEREIKEHIKRSGEKEIKSMQNAFYMNEDKEYVPFFENPKIRDVENKAEEILGLNYEQFRQVVILPQGQFEKFLVASSEKKESILSTLFNAQHWENITKWLCDKSLDMKREKEKLENFVKGSLNQYNCQNGIELKNSMDVLVKDKEIFGKEFKDREKEFLEVQNSYNLAKHLMNRFLEYDEILKEEAVIVKEKNEFKKIKELVKRSALAKSIMPLRQNASDFDKQKKHRKSEYDKKIKDIEIYENKLKINVQTLFGCLEMKKSEYRKLQDEKANITTEIEKLSSEYKRIFNEYMKDCAFVLSENLRVGQACPVCGSKEHKQKAPLSKGEYTIKQVKNAEEVLNYKKKLMSELEKKEVLILKDINNLQTQTLQQIQPTNIIPINKDASQSVLDVNNSYKDLHSVKELEQVAKNEYKKVKEEFLKAMDEYKKQCIQNGFANDEEFLACYVADGKIAEYEKQINEYAVRCEVNQRQKEVLNLQLKDIEKPNFAKFQTLYDEALIKKQSAEKNLADKVAKISIMEKALTEIFRQEEKYDKMSKEYMELDNFAKLLRGDNGIGLKRYVLGVMLICIANEANILLRHVHGGRFQIQKKSEYSGRARKVGLELEVFDGYSGEFRNVEGLSGGEKFLVALALSFGLSTVLQMQKGGISIDAMFVDEGFGSLDPSSIEDALNILAEVKGSNRLIGIISHVQMLKESIECGIEIKKDTIGSSICY